MDDEDDGKEAQDVQDLAKALKELSREDLETYALSSAVALSTIVLEAGGSAIVMRGMGEHRKMDMFRVSMFIRKRVAEISLQRN